MLSMVRLLVLGILICFIAGCSLSEVQTFEDLSYKEVYIGCLPGLIGSHAKFVVHNQEEYDNLLIEYYEKTKERYKQLWKVETDEELKKGLPFKNCAAKLIPIDFEKHTLLSHYATAGGCTREFNKDVKINHLNKKVIFTINVIEHGLCEPSIGYRASILIPKISEEYTVEFK